MSPMRFVQANGLRFGYLERGEGPLVLLLHGFPDNAETYRQALDDFAGAGMRAVAPFLRGYPPTDAPADGRYDPMTLGHDVEALIQALSPDGTAHLVGMDWGGTAIQAASITCPERIDSAVIMNAAHPSTLSRFATDPEQARNVFHFWFFQMDVAAPALGASGLAMIDYLWKLWSPAYEPGSHLESVRATLSSPGAIDAALQYYGALYRAAQDRTFPATDTTVATLSIFGSLDPTATYAHLEEPYYKGPYQRVTLDGVGHWPHLERRNEFNRRALAWMTSTARDNAAVR